MFCLSQCEVMVTDNGYPNAQTSRVNLRINVVRVPPPTWVGNNNQFTRIINEDQPLIYQLIDLEATKPNPTVRFTYYKYFLCNCIL